MSVDALILCIFITFILNIIPEIMKRNRLFLLAVLLPLLGVPAFFMLKQQADDKKPGSLGAAMSIGSEAGMSARMVYDIKRLRDPATGRIPDDIRAKELAYAATLPSDAGLSQAKGTAMANWDSRGPWNVGGRTRAFGIDVSNESNLIAGSCSGGMWRSTDGGQTWIPSSTPSQHQSASCLAQDTRAGHTNTWYMGSGEAYGASASASGAYFLGNGMYKSVDGGLTWTSLPSTVSGTPQTFDIVWDLIWNVRTYPADTINDVVFAATYGAVFRSADGGTTWSKVLGNPTTAYSYFTDVEVTPSGIVYATLSDDGPAKGIWRSEDGISFTNITPPNFPSSYNRIVIGYAPSDENQVYFLANTPGFGQADTNFLGTIEWNSLWKYQYLSGNGSGAGGYWFDRSMNLPTTGGPFDKFNCQGSYDLVVKVKPNDTNTVFIGGTNLYRSTSAFADDVSTTFIGGYEEGATLPVVNSYSNHHPDQHGLEFLPSNPDILFSANDGGVFKTTDNTATPLIWNSLNNGYLTTMFYTVALDHATPGSDIVIAGAQDNGTWYTNSAVPTDPWVTPRGGDGSYCFIADNEAAYYFSIQNGKMMKAKVDPNGNVDSFARIDPLGGTGYQFINPYVIDPNNNNLMYLAAGKYLWRNNDLSGIPYASNWDSITTNWFMFPDSVPVSGVEITAVAVSKTPANRVYFGTSNKRLYRMDNAHTGSPVAVEITSTTTGNFFPTNGNVSCIAIDPTDADKLLVVFSNYNVYSLFYSTDGGTIWTKAAGNLEQNSIGGGNGPSLRWASIMPVSNGTVYLVAASTGLYATSSLNGTGTVWVQQGAATIGNAVCDMIDFRQSDGRVVVATHAHGIYSSYITGVQDIVTVEEAATQLLDFNLDVFPNPVKGSTNVKYGLATAGFITLGIYDESGRLIRYLMQGQHQAGKREITADCSSLRAGVYYITLETAKTKRSRSIIVL